MMLACCNGKHFSKLQLEVCEASVPAVVRVVSGGWEKAMGHFHRLAGGERISQQRITVSGDSITVGFWGYLGFNGSELTVTSNTAGVSPVKGKVTGDSREWTIKSRVSAQARISALYTDEFGTHTWDWFEVSFGAAKGAPGPVSGRKYTNNPNEVPTQTTTPTARDVVDLLRSSWSDLTNNGARTLTAQFMHETGGGRNCYNWNLGNVKAGANEPHMYLHGPWECFGSAAAQADVNRGLSHFATAEEIRKRGMACAVGKVAVVYDPPHVQCRFRAYSSLQDGAQRWVQHHQGTARRNASFITALNAGDIPAVAHILKSVQYYSGDEGAYARAMTQWKAQIDQQLGSR